MMPKLSTAGPCSHNSFWTTPAKTHTSTHVSPDLQVLREQLNCNLPIELVWHTDEEMDMRTLNAIQQQWGNITGMRPAVCCKQLLPMWLSTAWSCLDTRVHPVQTTPPSRKGTDT
jgi:hypothetical protein